MEPGISWSAVNFTEFPTDVTKGQSHYNITIIKHKDSVIQRPATQSIAQNQENQPRCLRMKKKAD